ncbi:MAG: hypothetical protein OEY01_03680 [Desulfobulbaceae bacterium]|nr:hypothetical protein [Desulfobulbaceae bacterium]
MDKLIMSTFEPVKRQEFQDHLRKKLKSIRYRLENGIEISWSPDDLGLEILIPKGNVPFLNMGSPVRAESFEQMERAVKRISNLMERADTIWKDPLPVWIHHDIKKPAVHVKLGDFNLTLQNTKGEISCMLGGIRFTYDCLEESPAQVRVAWGKLLDEKIEELKDMKNVHWELYHV